MPHYINTGSATKKKNRSIGQRMQKASSPGVRLEIALEWAEDWRADHEDLLQKLNAASFSDDMEYVKEVTAQLSAVHRKKFEAIDNVLRRLVDQKQEGKNYES